MKEFLKRFTKWHYIAVGATIMLLVSMCSSASTNAGAAPEQDPYPVTSEMYEMFIQKWTAHPDDREGMVEKYWDMIRLEVAFIAKNAPIVISQTTRLDQVYIAGNVLHYEYSLAYPIPEGEQLQIFARSIIESICHADLQEFFIKEIQGKMVVSYTFYGGESYVVKANPVACGFGLIS